MPCASCWARLGCSRPRRGRWWPPARVPMAPTSRWTWKTGRGVSSSLGPARTSPWRLLGSSWARRVFPSSCTARRGAWSETPNEVGSPCDDSTVARRRTTRSREAIPTFGPWRCCGRPRAFRSGHSWTCRPPASIMSCCASRATTPLPAWLPRSATQRRPGRSPTRSSRWDGTIRRPRPPGRSQGPHCRMADDRRQTLIGRAVLDDRVVGARIVVADGQIESIEEDDAGDAGPYLSPGFVDVHVHGWGGHDAMGDEAALDGMARALLSHGVTSFVPAAVTSPLEQLAAFADRVRGWMPSAPEDGAEPLGFNIEGPCISPEKKGAQNEAFIKLPSAVDRTVLQPMLDGLRIMTVAPEREGALDLVGWLARAGVNVSLGHSNATGDEAS